MRRLSKRTGQKPYRICFTHGNISPTNVLVDKNYVPVGLIDWGCAGWMLEYWELTSSLYRRLATLHGVGTYLQDRASPVRGGTGSRDGALVARNALVISCFDCGC